MIPCKSKNLLLISQYDESQRFKMNKTIVSKKEMSKSVGNRQLEEHKRNLREKYSNPSNIDINSNEYLKNKVMT